jgi:hypothetical protein
MGVVDDVLKYLERWDVWKRVTATPERMDALEKRVAELEAKLGDTSPGDLCRFCGKRTLRLHHVFGPDRHGKMREQWRCQDQGCNLHEERIAK